MAYDLPRLEQALINADKAGDTEAAKAFAEEIRKMRSAPKVDTPLGEMPQAGIRGSSPDSLSEAMSKGPTSGEGVDVIRTALNLPGSAQKFAYGAYDALRPTNLPNTLRGIAGLGPGLASMAPQAIQNMPITPGTLPLNLLSAVGGMAADRDKKAALAMTEHFAGYLEPGGLKERIETDPIQSFLDLSMVYSPLKAMSASKGVSAPRVKGYPDLAKPWKAEGGPANPETIRVANRANEMGYVAPKSYIALKEGRRQGSIAEYRDQLAGRDASKVFAQSENIPKTDFYGAKQLGQPDLAPQSFVARRKELAVPFEQAEKAGQISFDRAFSNALREIKIEHGGTKTTFRSQSNPHIAGLVQKIRNDIKQSGGGNVVNPSEVIDEIRTLRSRAGGHIANAQDPLITEFGYAEKAVANAMEDLLERQLSPRLGKTWLKDMRASREGFAQNYLVEQSLTGGNLDLALMHRLAKGEKLTGYLKDMDDFFRFFPNAAKLPHSPWGTGGNLQNIAYGSVGGYAAGPAGAAAAIHGMGMLKRKALERSVGGTRMTGQPPFNTGPYARGLLAGAGIYDDYNQGLLGQ